MDCIVVKDYRVGLRKGSERRLAIMKITLDTTFASYDALISDGDSVRSTNLD